MTRADPERATQRRGRKLSADLAAAAVAAWLSGCTTVGPDYAAPELNPPQGYAMAGEAAASGVRLDPDARVAGPWWQAFGSEALDQTVALALAESPNVAEAKAALERYQAREDAARGEGGPEVLADGSAQRQKFNSQAFGFPGFPSRTFNLFSLGGSVSYDLDLFGGQRRRAEAAGAETERAAREADAAYLALSGNVALEAMRLAGLRAEIATLSLIIDDDRTLLGLARQSEALGGVARTTVTQVEALLAQDEAELPPLQRKVDAARHRLALLAGKAPAEWSPPEFHLDQFAVPADIPISLPSDLIRRRPDILAAEADLHAATAAIGIAISDQYPQVRLSAKGALSARKPGDVLSMDSTGWTLLSGVTAPIFDGGVRKARTREAEAEARAALARYRQTVLAAFTQVADVLAALQTDQTELEALNRAVDASGQQADDILTAARLGAANAQQVIESRRQLNDNRRDLAAAQARRLADTVELFAASAADWRAPQASGGPGGAVPGR